ncbi:TPA: DNA adenine methylase [Vibrio parahaemolyticus]|uniref:DNA adenine methylase n=1 Tax=Vibrio vulnificus TaxID=672 RepID=UPI001FAF51AD|nr:DNA adenine methylase [Vibrio vulnificus]MCJ0814286.1 DNA adenine methylase [Vibrio vulnificus]HCH1007100.1 DNA adenine methylase [Vibrio parahaemolyticus]
MKIPHVIPYQGSKRKLAESILRNVEGIDIDTLYEPFSGSAAITLAAAAKGLANNYVLNDKYAPIMSLWDLIINEPELAADRYEIIWSGQVPQSADSDVDAISHSYKHFMEIRKQFNQDDDPIKFLYLMARCVKNAVRFNTNGEFNQSPDKRRKGTAPDKMRSNILGASSVLKGKSRLYSEDFKDITSKATSNDLIYMDPPWQGTSTKKDTRYAFILQIDELIAELQQLNNRNVPYILSFDGVCGDKSYGKDLPKHLNLKKTMLDAGRSSQAILLGREDKTLESLYLSPALSEKMESKALIAV